jgi:hypothetical protein
MQRAGQRLTGSAAIAALALLAGCGRTADAVPASAGSRATATAPTGPSAPAAPVSATGPAAAAVCPSAPFATRVAAVRRESADSIRVELAISNGAPTAGGPQPAAAEGQPDALAGPQRGAAADSGQAVAQAFDGVSVLSTDGRRRMFPLRDTEGEPVGPPITVPAPGRTETFWRLFPAAEGQVDVLVPGCAPFAGLRVAAGTGQPEP